MRLSSSAVFLLFSGIVESAFIPKARLPRSEVVVHGYLDDLTRELMAPVDEPDLDETLEATNLEEENIDRYGPGEWSTYRDFGDEFDGGDGQMGVAGDGNKALEKFGSDVQPQLAKSKVMSAKNAWGKTTGYAETLVEQGMDVARAQQIENWRNQQELKRKKDEHMKMTDEFDSVTYEENWRSLSKFGIERNQEFDMDETFGAVSVGSQVEGTIELRSRIGQVVVHEFNVKNDYMGFADFRAAFTPESADAFSVTPTEGSLNKDGVDFIVKYKPEAPVISHGYLVIETEDFKKAWKVVGTTA